MIQVRLLVCGCLEIDFLCCMLYASPLPPKLHRNRLKEIPSSYLPLLFLCCATFFFSMKLNKTLFQRDRKYSLLLSFTAMCSISYTQRHLSVVSKNCTTHFCLHAWIRFYKHGDPPQYNGNDEQAPSRTAVRSAFWGCNELTHSI
jgi:hypothetical protein